ncbi:MAG: hypothetical protein JST46_16725 [Bacteroidetes bacterium]|nr:hypothetical protein [Bacteroidota bacterium]
MKKNNLLVISSLLSILFTSVHVTGDIIYGFEKGGTSNLIILPILALWLYGTLVLTDHKGGYIIILLASLLGLAVPIVHMKGAGLASQVSATIVGYVFVWTTIALGVTSILSIVLSIGGLLRRDRPV